MSFFREEENQLLKNDIKTFSDWVSYMKEFTKKTLGWKENFDEGHIKYILTQAGIISLPKDNLFKIIQITKNDVLLGFFGMNFEDSDFKKVTSMGDKIRFDKKDKYNLIVEINLGTSDMVDINKYCDKMYPGY